MTQIQTGIVKQAMQITLEGRGEITLHPSDHIATGGEGSIYKPSSKTIIKLYSDIDKMKNGMEDKLRLLASINHPFIVAPKGLVLKGNKPIGYYMDFISGEPLARVFTTSFRQRENFTDQDTMALVNGMRTTIMEAHAHHAILVDANEFNWLMYRNKKVIEPRVIDIDSWAIGQWKASVIMPSIRDWHTNGFTKGSDWFSFAIVSFQVFTGIHPYKGMLAGYKPNDIEARMKDNKSVFTTGVRLNSAVRDFNVIPKALLQWYEAVFQQKERSIPPPPTQTTIYRSPHHPIVTTGTDSLVFTSIYDGKQSAPAHIYSCGLVLTDSGSIYSLASGTLWQTNFQHSVEIIETEYGYLAAEVVPGETVQFFLLEKSGAITPLPSQLQGMGLLRFQERLFVVAQHGLVEVGLKHFGKPIIVTKTTWQILAKATVWYRGVGIQQSLGSVHLILPFDEVACTYVVAAELKGKKVVDAIAGTRYCVVIALDSITGKYYSYSYTFSKTYDSHTVEITECDTPDLNVALLPKGVCASIVEDGKLRIAVPITNQVREVSDAQIKTVFILSNWQNKVLFIHDKKIWTVATKP